MNLQHLYCLIIVCVILLIIETHRSKSIVKKPSIIEFKINNKYTP